MNQNYELVRNTVLQTIAKVLSIGLGWFAVVAMTNHLGAAGFGSYTIMVAYLQFFGVAADLGFVLVSSQLLAERTADREKIFANLFTFRLVTAGALIALAPIFIWLFPYSDAVQNGVVVLSLSFFLIALLQVFTGLFQATLKMGRAMAAELLGRIVLLAFLLVAMSKGYGLIFIVWGVVFGSLANVLLAWLLAQSVARFYLAYDKEIWQTIWLRSWPIAVGIIFNLIYLKADTLILTFVRGEVEVGVYGAMYRMLEVLITFPTMFASLLLPLLAGYWVNAERERFVTLAQQSLDAMVYMALPLIVGVWMTAPQLVPLFGADFVELGVPVLRWLVVAIAAIFIGTLLGHIVVAIGQQRAVLRVYGGAAALGLALYLIVVPMYGAYGAAISTMLIELIVTVYLYLFIKRHTALVLRPKSFVVALIAVFPMLLFLMVAIFLPLYVIVPVAILIYLFALYLLGAITPQFISQLLGRST